MDNVMIKKGSGNIDQSFFGLQNMSRKIPFLVIYRVGNFDDLMQSGVWVIAKTTFANLCKPIKQRHNYSSFIWPFESGNCRRKGQKIEKKNEYLENEKTFLDEIKIILHNFWNAFFW